ncbi:response regulator ArlR [Lysinibacillus alkalisoli]|uniref:Response regulator ArlR n=1 Tax=Lysinibacillus alkalisoli TaxID=1911548 RepID=A0A917LCW5_9BACI|nr:response regulator transcription factor [Lysinibacillus alkalisoli]GGG14107.1 response regulator ArlR [Lysinibacillus alkalisoli]
MSIQVMIVEDEKSIARFLELELKHEGFDVTIFHDGRDGYESALTQDYDVLLLDVMLPGLNGIEICRRIRTKSDVPIILLTARDAVMDRVGGLDAGADDYIVKPFAIEELLARIRTILRRTKKEETTIELNQVVMDMKAHEVYVEGERIGLTKTEYDLLHYLLTHLNQVCTRENILTAVWGFETEVETNVVDVYIRHLRTKLQTALTIETVRGVGYVIRQ